MEEQLILFETVKLAKEKGFYYPRMLNVYYGEEDQKIIKPYDLPTQLLLQKWLREKHNIYMLNLLIYINMLRKCLILMNKL